MKSRRDTLSAVGALVTIGIAGCLTESEDENGNDNERFLAVTNGEEKVVAATYDHVESVAEPTAGGGGYSVPTELTADGRESFLDALEGVDAFSDASEVETVVYKDGEELQRLEVTDALLDQYESSEFDGTFVLQFEDQETAETMYDALTE